MDDFSFSIFQVHFIFCLLNFIVLIPYLINYHTAFNNILFCLGSDRRSGLLFFWPALLLLHTYFHLPSSLHTLDVCFLVNFHSCCSHARVFEKTLLHEFLISYRNTAHIY